MSAYFHNNGTYVKVLMMIVSVHVEARTESLLVLLNEFQAMCESGFNPKMVLFTFSSPSKHVQRYLSSKAYCYRMKRYLPIEYVTLNSSSQYHLPDATRSYMAGALDTYDVFMYLEDDMILKNSHLVGYIQETQQLDALMKKDYEKLALKDGKAHSDGRDYIIGFHRISQFKRDKKKQREVESDEAILQHERLVEQPSYEPICIGDAPYIQSPSHQAVWILLRHQVLALQNKCRFLNQTSEGRNLPREYMSSFSLFDPPSSGGCSLTKVFPARHYLHFNVLHYFDGFSEVSTSVKAAVVEVEHNLTHGLLMRTSKEGDRIVRQPWRYPQCWHSLIRENNPGWTNETSLRNLSAVDDVGGGGTLRGISSANLSSGDGKSSALSPSVLLRGITRPNTSGAAQPSWREVRYIYQEVEVTQLIFIGLVFALVSLYRFRNNVRRMISGSEVV